MNWQRLELELDEEPREEKGMYIIIIGSLSGSMYQTIPSEKAYLVNCTRVEAMQTFAMLYSEILEMTVREMVTDRMDRPWPNQDSEENYRRATNEEVDKHISKMTLDRLSDNYFLGYEEFNFNKWKNYYCLPLNYLEEVIIFQYD